MATIGTAGDRNQAVANLKKYLQAIGYTDYSLDYSWTSQGNPILPPDMYIPWNADGTIDQGGVGNAPGNVDQAGYQTYLTSNPSLQPKQATVDELLSVPESGGAGVPIQGALN